MFDVAAARSAGYSDGEIASFLGSQSGFDVDGATKAGYAPSEIVGFLSQQDKGPPADLGPAPTGDPLSRVTPSGATINPTFTVSPNREPKVSVLQDAPAPDGIPVSAMASPETKAEVSSAFDAATPAQRAKLAEQRGIRGVVARERSDAFAQQDANAQGLSTDSPLRYMDPRIEAPRSAPHLSDDKATYRQRAEDYVRSLLGVAASSEQPDQKAAAQAFIMATAQRDNISVDDLRNAVGGMRPELDQFARSAIDAGTLGLVPDNTMAADGLPQIAAKGLGGLAGFIAVPAAAGMGVVRGVAGDALAASMGDSIGARLAKSVIEQASVLGLASAADATGKALDTRSGAEAADVVADAYKGGTRMGGVFGAAGRVIPGSSIAAKAGRVVGINAGLDALQGTNPLDDRAPEQKVFDYGLNTYFALHGSPVAAREKNAADAVRDKWGSAFSARPEAPSEPAARPDPIAPILKATNVDDAISAAQEAVRPAAPFADEMLAIRPLEKANVSQPVAPDATVSAGAGGRSIDDAGSLKSGGLLDSSARGDVGAATGAVERRGEDAVLGVPGSEPGAVEPAKTWFGRRGDGYVTQGDASIALASRQKAEPELNWRVEPMPSGKFRLAGYADEGAKSSDVPESRLPSSADLPLPTHVERSNGLGAVSGVPRTGEHVDLAPAPSRRAPADGALPGANGDAVRPGAQDGRDQLVPAAAAAVELKPAQFPTKADYIEAQRKLMSDKADRAIADAEALPDDWRDGIWTKPSYVAQVKQRYADRSADNLMDVRSFERHYDSERKVTQRTAEAAEQPPKATPYADMSPADKAAFDERQGIKPGDRENAAAAQARIEQQNADQRAVDAERILDAAGIKGAERLTAVKDVKTGVITLDELARAHQADKPEAAPEADPGASKRQIIELRKRRSILESLRTCLGA